MIIIITGASHTGKTMLAQRLLEKYKYPYISIDHIKMGLIRSGNTNLTPLDDDKLTDYLWPIVSEIIKTAIENNQNLIVEGCYIPYDWRKSFESNYLKEIKFICLALSDNYIDHNFDVIKNKANIIETRLEDSCLSTDKLKIENKNFIDGFNNEKIIIIDSDYENTIELFIKSYEQKIINKYLEFEKHPKLIKNTQN